LAKKIIFDEDKRATGVLVDTADVQYILSVSREVIISSGVVGQPI
jgi:choline dehydrogenase